MMDRIRYMLETRGFFWDALVAFKRNNYVAVALSATNSSVEHRIAQEEYQKMAKKVNARVRGYRIAMRRQRNKSGQFI